METMNRSRPYQTFITKLKEIKTQEKGCFPNKKFQKVIVEPSSVKIQIKK